MIDRPLNILIVASWYPDEKHPTNGSFIEEQAQMLKKEGNQVLVLHPFLTGTFVSSILKKEICSFDQWNEIPVLRVGVKPVLPGQRSLAYRKLYRACKKILKRHQVSIEQFEVIHSHAMFMGGFIAMNLAQEFNKSFFHTEHTSGLIFKPEQYNQFDRSTIHEVFNSAKKVFFVSQYAMEKTLERYSLQKTNSHEVLPNLVNDCFFKPVEHLTFSEPFSYIIICNLIPLKRVDLLLNAWKKLLKVFPESKLTITGDGPEKENLISFVELHNLERSVNFVPKLSRAEVKQQIDKHHVLVSTSQLETFGLTVAESQAMGKPVVVTDSGGVRDIVDDRTGIITEQTVEGFAQGLVSIQRNYSNYDPRTIRENAKRKFSSETIYGKLINYYYTALE